MVDFHFWKLISRCNNGNLNFSSYRKPPYTDSYLDFNLHHDKQNISTVNTLHHRALNLPNAETRIARKIDRISSNLHSNGYPLKIILEIIKKKLATSGPSHPNPTLE